MRKKNNIMNLLTNCILSMVYFFSIYHCHKFLFADMESTFIIASFGASAVIVFLKDKIEVSFIKILLVSGIAGFIGVWLSSINLETSYKLSLGIGMCMLLLGFFKTYYPPAGAIILIPLIAGDEITKLGYTYVCYPTLTGLVIIHIFSKIKKELNKYIYYGK